MDDQKTTQALVNAAKAVPFENLIGGPLVACVDAQRQAADATSQFIKEVGIDPASGEVALVHFTFLQEGQKRRMSVPLLSIVPIPYIQINNIKLNFRADMSLDSNDNFVAKFATQAGAASSDSETSGNSTLKLANHLDVEIQAIGTSMPAGLGKLLDVFANNCMRIEDVTMRDYTIQLNDLGKRLGASVFVREGGFRGTHEYKRLDAVSNSTDLGYLPDGTPCNNVVEVECTETMPLEIDKVSATPFSMYLYTKEIKDSEIFVKYQPDPSKMYHVDVTGYAGRVDVYVSGTRFDENTMYQNIVESQIRCTDVPGYDHEVHIDKRAIQIKFVPKPDCLYTLSPVQGAPNEVEVLVDGQPYSPDLPYADLVPNRVQVTSFEGYVPTVTISGSRDIKVSYRQQKAPATGTNKYTVVYNDLGNTIKGVINVLINNQAYKSNQSYKDLKASQVSADVSGYTNTIYIEGTVIHIDYAVDPRYLYTETITGNLTPVTLKINNKNFDRQTPYVGLKASSVSLTPSIPGYKPYVQVVGNEILVNYEIDPTCLFTVEWKDRPAGVNPQVLIDKEPFDPAKPYANLKAASVTLDAPIVGCTHTISIQKQVIVITFAKDPSCFYKEVRVVGASVEEAAVTVDGAVFSADKAYPNLTESMVECKDISGLLHSVAIDRTTRVITVTYTLDPANLYQLSITGVPVPPSVLINGAPFVDGRAYMALTEAQITVVGTYPGYNMTKVIDRSDPNKNVIRIDYTIKPECKYSLSVTGMPQNTAIEVRVNEGGTFYSFNADKPYVGLTASMVQVTEIAGFKSTITISGQIIQVRYVDDPACFYTTRITGNPGPVTISVRGRAFSPSTKYIGLTASEVVVTSFPGYVCNRQVSGTTIIATYSKDTTSWYTRVSSNKPDAVKSVTINGAEFNPSKPYPGLTSSQIDAPTYLGHTKKIQFLSDASGRYIYIQYDRIASQFYTVKVTGTTASIRVIIDGSAYDVNTPYPNLSLSQISVPALANLYSQVSIVGQEIRVDYVPAIKYTLKYGGLASTNSSLVSSVKVKGKEYNSSAYYPNNLQRSDVEVVYKDGYAGFRTVSQGEINVIAVRKEVNTARDLVPTLFNQLSLQGTGGYVPWTQYILQFDFSYNSVKYSLFVYDSKEAFDSETYKKRTQTGGIYLCISAQDLLNGDSKQNLAILISKATSASSKPSASSRRL